MVVVVLLLLLQLNNPFIRMNIKGSFSLPSLTYINLFCFVHCSLFNCTIERTWRNKWTGHRHRIFNCYLLKMVWIFAFGIFGWRWSQIMFDSKIRSHNNPLAHAYTRVQMVFIRRFGLCDWRTFNKSKAFNTKVFQMHIIWFISCAHIILKHTCWRHRGTNLPWSEHA